MIDLTACVYTRNRGVLLEHMLTTFDKTTPSHVPVIIIQDVSNYESIKRTREIVKKLNRKVFFIEKIIKSNWSRLNNLAIINSPTRYVLIVHNDIGFLEGWYEDVVSHLELGFLNILMFHHRCFALDKKLINLIGWFDERFPEGIYADDDWGIRVAGECINMSPVFAPDPMGIYDKSNRIQHNLYSIYKNVVGVNKNLTLYHTDHFDPKIRALSRVYPVDDALIKKNDAIESEFCKGWACPDRCREFFYQKWGTYNTRNVCPQTDRRIDEIDWYPYFTKCYEKEIWNGEIDYE